MVVLLFGLMVLLLLLGMDVALALAASVLFYLAITGLTGDALPLIIIPHGLLQGANSFSLVAVPLFVLAGEIMTKGGITRRLVTLAQALVGHFRGGLAQTAVGSNLIMAGISGSAVADATATGSVLIPAMEKGGYPRRFGAAVVASASTVGPVIPPSIPMVIVGATAGISTGELFLGGAVPGLLMGLILMACVAVVARRRQFPQAARATRDELLVALRDALLALGLPIIVLGAILLGLTTATEAAALAVLYALLLTVVVYRSLSFRELVTATGDAAVLSSAIMLVVSAGVLFGLIATAEGLAATLSDLLAGITTSQILLLLILNVLLLVLGTLLEPIPVILLVTPILFPLIEEAGIDPIHFGVIMVINLCLGLITPPIGLLQFITAGIARVSVGEVVRESWVFLFGLIACLVLLVLIPDLVLWLPGLFFE